jgi:hypothetical protein
MSAFIQGKADYAFGKTITPYSNNNNVTPGTHLKDPFKNINGTQDYTTYYQGGNGKAIVPGTGLKNVPLPTADPKHAGS